MIDLSTDDGVREALKEIASWPAPAPIQDATVPYAAERPEPQAPRSAYVLAAVAVLLLIVGAAAILWTGGAAAPVAAARGEWRGMADAPLAPRFEPVTLWTGDELLVWGGYDVDNVELVDGAAYDPSTDEWRTIADVPFEPVRRTGVPVGQPGTSMSYDVDGAVVDGVAYFAVATDESAPLVDLVAYDPLVDAWRMVGRTPFQGVETVTTTGNVLAVVGWRPETDAVGWATVDPASGDWSEPLDVPNSGALAGFPPIGGADDVDGRAAVLRGGPIDRQAPMGFLLEPGTGEVTLLEMPTELPFGAATAGIWGELASDGTLVGVASSDDGQLARVAYRLDPTNGRWSAVASPSAGPTDGDHQAMVVAVRDGTLVLGGLELDGTEGGLRSVPAAQATDEGAHRWQSLPGAPIDLDRVGHVAVWTGDEVIVWGGATAGGSGNVPTVPLADGAIYRLAIASSSVDPLAQQVCPAVATGMRVVGGTLVAGFDTTVGEVAHLLGERTEGSDVPAVVCWYEDAEFLGALEEPAAMTDAMTVHVDGEIVHASTSDGPPRRP
ncbi:Kelch repeat-containing protein [Actinomarinicola tropica]|uniref:Galactose oxidase n=1 Tax=Actinomarinicola tropica TaxID=2789776 RepID=A0A5Q2RLM7_9ACTN|nr:hypothetical protein [Actinomarinicola tropica]QGG96743.1 hypothetical protein GH723_17490 [Actinomarinicola tropica]